MNLPLLYELLYKWYEENHRILPWRETSDPYKIWISEIILQQTRVNQGLEYYLRFVNRFPDVETLAAATEDEVLLYWQGLGYYSRARNLHKGAQMIAGKPFPDSIQSLQAIPGVGEYTAGAIASFAYNLPHPALDGNVYRVLSRLYDEEMPFDTTQGKKHFHVLAEQLLDRHNARLFNSAIMEFGALFCTPQSPNCSECPLQTFCKAYSNATVALLPVRKARPKIRDRYMRYTIYIQKNSEQNILDCQTLIHQRQGKDIWQHLWEFPVEEQDTPFEQVPGSIQLTHILSHQRLHVHFRVVYTDVLPDINATKKVLVKDLQDFALSKLTLRALDSLFSIQ